MSDTLLIPVTTVQPDLVTQTDVVVYVPLASKDAHGIVKIGEGLDISADGLVVLDRAEVTIKEIAKNGELIAPDENKRVNIELSQNDVGLDRVDNTSDLEKPVSDATRLALDILADEISDLNIDFERHINDFNNPHKVTKEQVGLSNVDNTSDKDKPISSATQAQLDVLSSLIKGADQALAYENYAEMVSVFNSADKTKFSVGQTVFIGTLTVPDLWVYKVESTSEPHSYVSDDLIKTILSVDGSIKIGYYVLAPLETNTVDITNVVTIDTEQKITGKKNFTSLYYNGDLVATDKELKKITPLILQFDANSSSSVIEYENDVLTFNGYYDQVSVDMATKNTYYGKLVLPIVGEGIDLRVEKRNNQDFLILSADIPEIDTSKVVTLDDVQTITGTKIFTEQIAILNGSQGDMNFIKHINNNFLISTSGGENIINIDEQLKTFNFYNKPLALEEHVEDNYVSFTKSQSLTDAQKEIARNNIGAGTGGGGTGTSIEIVWWGGVA